MLLAAFVSACSRSNADARVQRLVDYYAPGIRIGAAPTTRARSKYHLSPLASFGVGDRDYNGPDGTHSLALWYDPASSRARVTGNETIQWVSVGLSSSQALRLAIARVTKALGKPTRDVCSDYPARHTKLRVLMWLTAHGRLVEVKGEPSSWETDSDSLDSGLNSIALNEDGMPIGQIVNSKC